MNTRKVLSSLLAVVFVAFVAVNLYAASGRESNERPPQEIKIMHQSEDHALNVKDINDVIRFRVLPDGTLAIYNTSGATVYGINGSDGKPTYGEKTSYVNVAYGGGTKSGNPLGYATGVTAYSGSSRYSTYILDLTGASRFNTTSAVSFYMPVGSPALDGFKIHINRLEPQSVGTGVTEVFLVPANDTLMKTGQTDFIYYDGGITKTPGSATYNVFAYNVINANGESAEFVYRYVAGGGTWYQISGTSRYGS